MSEGEQKQPEAASSNWSELKNDAFNESKKKVDQVDPCFSTFSLLETRKIEWACSNQEKKKQ